VVFSVTNIPNADLCIDNTLGQPVLSDKITAANTTFDLTAHPDGLYFIHIILNDNLIIKKVFANPHHTSPLMSAFFAGKLL